MPITLRHHLFCILTFLLLQACSGEQNVSEATEVSVDTRPNILLIVADDLGYADLGFYGSEIPTPNIDALAANGMLLTDFFSSLTCGPTRSMLMSGTDNHMAGVGVQSAPSNPRHMNQPNYLGYLSFRVASLAELMTEAGYNTYMTGKWHLGSDVENGAHARGFKKNFVSLDGAAHLGPWDWRGPQNANYRDGDELVQVDDDWYTTRDYTQKMIEYIEEDRDENKPFFAYLAYTAPHWPLQAPADIIARFKGTYDEGYETIYQRRFASMQALGHIPADAEPMPLEVFSPRWDEQSDEEKALSAKRMEVYAAMVSELDTYVGQVINYLKETGQYDNTFIMFMSDNGAESSRLDLSPRFQNVITPEYYDQTVDNLGSPTSYVMYGRNWATVSETRFRRHKATAFEGGIHVPAFVHYPSMIDGGTQADGFGTVMDVMPTFLALAGTQHPGTSFNGRDILPIKGKSLLPMITGEVDEVHSEEEIVGWELNGHRAVRQGDWKIVWDLAAREDAHWMLFNLAEDPNEQIDLGTELPDKLAQMIENWERYEEENGLIYVYPE
jgi:arylsulfatase A-like enzyme